MLGFTIALSVLTGLLMGDLSGASGLPRGFGRRFEGRRPRNERKRAAAALPQNSRRCASRAFGDVVCRRGVAHHEFYSVDASRTSGSNRIICGPGATRCAGSAISRRTRRVSVLPSKSSLRCATYQASRARLSAAIFRSLVEIARFTRAQIAMCRQWRSERGAPSHDVVPGLS